MNKKSRFFRGARARQSVPFAVRRRGWSSRARITLGQSYTNRRAAAFRTAGWQAPVAVTVALLGRMEQERGLNLARRGGGERVAVRGALTRHGSRGSWLGSHHHSLTVLSVRPLSPQLWPCGIQSSGQPQLSHFCL